MARKTKIVKIETEGRDKGKEFFITELSAWDAEMWALRAMTAMMNAGVTIPDNIKESGMAGIIHLSLTALTKIKFEDAKPLLDKILECVQFKFKGGVRALVESDIEEIATLLFLRKEVLLLHFDFFTEGGESILGSSAQQ